jgi:thiol:disulfide interchange protein
MNVSLEKITAPVAFVIVGFVMIVIGSTGAVPIINQPVAGSSVLFLLIGIVLVLAALVFVWREQVSQKTFNNTSTAEPSTTQKQVRTKYAIKITSPVRGNKFKGGPGDRQ